MTRWILIFYTTIASFYVPLAANAQNTNKETSQNILTLANAGDAAAQYNLGLIYANGIGVQENDVEAVRWFRLAAEQGNIRSQVNLANMYAQGDGVTQNFITAYIWVSLSAAQGDQGAKSGKAIIASMMTKEQITEAEQLATTCLANNYKNCD